MSFSKHAFFQKKTSDPGCALRVTSCGVRVTGCELRVVPIVLVVVLVLVIEKAEYVRKIRWGVEDEDEYKDEYESPAGCEVWVAGYGVRGSCCGLPSELLPHKRVTRNAQHATCIGYQDKDLKN